jgi:anti-sigma factor RsiW
MSSANIHVDDLLDDYLHDLLTPQERDRVEGHCARCPECARAMEQARRRLALLQSMPPAEPSAQLVPATVARVESTRQVQTSRRKRILWAAAGALAAAVLLLVAANVYYANLKPSRFDLVVLGQTQWFAASKASLRIRLVDRGGALMAGVPVVVTLEAPDGRRQELARFDTDAQGAGNPRFDVPDWADGQYQLRVAAATPDGADVIARSVRLTRSWRLMLSSDKPVYQPGQTILARALSLRRPDLLPARNQPAVFTLTDPRGNVLFKHTTATSAYGICSAECALAQEILEGSYTLACKIGDTESRLSLEIRRYVLPKFKVEVTPDRPYYAPGQTGSLTVQSDYFFGKPVVNADVQVVLGTPDAGTRVVGKLTGKTDEQGRAKLTFTVPAALVGRETDAGDARLNFTVSVTDSAKQKYQGFAERIVTTRPIKIEAIPEAGKLVMGVSNTVYVLVTRANGEPAPGLTVEATGDNLKTKAKTDERGAASFQVTPMTPQVSMILRAVTDQGDVLARKHVVLTDGGGAGTDFLLRTDRAVYRAGQTIELTALGSGVEPVFVDFIKDGQTLLSETVEVTGGKGEHHFDLPADLFGTIQLVAYRFTSSGVPLRKVRVLYVAPPDGLKIAATLDRDEYRPGKQATLRMSLTDSKGKPTPGAISLAAVDSAVFSVLAQRPGMEKTFYSLEQELLKPVYAIYPWSPGESGSPKREQAVFSATAHDIRGLSLPGEPQKLEPQFVPEAAPEPHSLAANSFPAKEREVQQAKSNGFRMVRYGWVGLVLTILLAAYTCLWVFFSPTIVLKMHGVGAVVLLCLALGGGVMMALLSSRYESKRAAAFDTSGSMAAPQIWREAKSAAMETKEDAPPPGIADPSSGATGDLSNTVQGGDQPAPPRVRREFPETLLWKPQLITDDQGKLPPVPIHLADSITTWKLAASAVAADGRLGSTQLPLKVFQPFFVEMDLPVYLTRGDEVGVRVVVYNYLARPQTVNLTIKKAGWFDLTGDEALKLDLAANEIRAVPFMIKVNQAGTHKLQVAAVAGKIGDAVEREILVVPDGKRIETAHSGTLEQLAEINLEVPETAIEGSVGAFVKLYPSSFSQVVEGLDNIFQMPSGCFEQTSSTTYPNVLALSYLRRNNQKSPRVEAKARQYIHLGYQRLVGFEVPGGGFDWFGNPPANRTLTAYGLMEFTDMAKVHDVDPNLIARTRSWLLAQRKPDGSWDPEGHAMHDDALRADQRLQRLATTAYIAWAVFADGQESRQAGPTRDFLLAHVPGAIPDSHVLALVCNALTVLDPEGKESGPYLDRLAAMKKVDASGKFTWWEQSAGARTMFHGGGSSARVETTALAAVALIQGKRHPGAVRGALSWLVSQKDPRGTWYSTQATVLSLRALLAGSGKVLGGDGARQFVVRIGDHVEEVSLPADQAEVMKQLDLSRFLKPGGNTVRLSEKSDTGAGYQVVFRYHVPEAKKPQKETPLAIAIDYDRTELAAGDVVKAKATVVNRMPATAPMVMLDLPVPPGFSPEAQTFANLVNKGVIARYQVRPRSVLVYLRGLAPGKPLELAYTLRATMPVKATAPGARVYEYYDPQKQGSSPATRFTVVAKK